MQIEVVQYTSERESEWDNFIENNKRNATFLHSRKFFKHNPLNEIDDASLMFYKKNKLIALLPASLNIKEDKSVYHSHPRCTYGGFVIHESFGVEEAMVMVANTINFAKDKVAEEIIIRNPFRIFHHLPSDETDYALWYHGFKIKYRELECCIKLDDNYEKKFDNGAKYNIKKAKKTITVKETNDYPSFWELLTDNLLQKHNISPTHSIEQFLTLEKLVGEEKIKLFGGYADNKLVCGVVVFIGNSIALHAQYIASDNNYQEIRPLNAVIDYIINWGYKNSFKYFNLGTGNSKAGNEINYGLFHFKEGFGGRGILRETMHLILDK